MEAASGIEIPGLAPNQALQVQPSPLLKRHPAQPTLASVETPDVWQGGVVDSDDAMDLALLALRFEHAQLKSREERRSSRCEKLL